jgi:plastocyanin
MKDRRNEDRRSAVTGVAIAIGVALLMSLSLLAGWAVGKPAVAAGDTAQQPAASAGRYAPQTRDFVMTIVPQWVHEVTGTYDYLGAEFVKKGLLSGKEVWGFSPSSITVYQGDTVSIALYNPSSDPHTWTITGLDVNVPIGATAMAPVKFVANQVGVFTFNCEVGEHFPFMTGQLVVLPASDAPQS